MPLNWDLEERQHQTEQVSLQPVGWGGGGGGACLQVEEGGGLWVAVFADIAAGGCKCIRPKSVLASSSQWPATEKDGDEGVDATAPPLPRFPSPSCVPGDVVMVW
jgi:hypothetical protein